MGVVEVAAVGFGRAVVLAQDSLEHFDAQPTRLVPRMVADAAVVVVAVTVVVLMVAVVVRMARAISVVVEASHG